MKKKIYILHKLPTPYNDDLFRAIHREKEMDLQVYHLWKGSARRPWTEKLATGYNNYYLKTFLGIDWTSFKKALFDKNSLFIVGDWAHIPTIALLFARIIRGSEVAIWVDTPQEQLYRPPFKRFFRSKFLKFLLNKVDFILASGKPARRSLISMGVIPDKIVDFQFIVDLDRVSKLLKDEKMQENKTLFRKKIGCNDECVLFGMSGTIDFEKKAQDLGLHAFSDCINKSKKNIRMLVAGEGGDLEKLKNIAKELEIEKHVTFLGWQEPFEMHNFNMNIDILLHPANYDPFPLAVLEAMSWGNAIVGTNTCGSIEERVVDGLNGFSVPPNDKGLLVTAMMKFIENEKLLKSAKFEATKTSKDWPMSRAVGIIKSHLK
jgi:glycosyltransferase involved in cell wall biosynthesis